MFKQQHICYILSKLCKIIWDVDLYLKMHIKTRVCTQMKIDENR